MIRALKFIVFVAVLGYGADFADADLGTGTDGVYSVNDDARVDSLDIASELGATLSDLNKIEINTPLATINLNGTTQTAAGLTNRASLGIGGADGNYAFDITASALTLTGLANDKSAAQIQAFFPSTISASTTLSNARISLAGLNSSSAPTLSIDGDFIANNSRIEHYETGLNGINSTFVVNGASTIRDTEFSIITTASRASKPILRYVVMSSTGGYNADVLTSNSAFMKVSKNLSMLETQYGVSILERNSQYADVFKEGKDTLFTNELKQEGDKLIIERSLGSATFKSIELNNIQMDIDIIDEFLTRIQTGDERTRLGNLKTFLQMRKDYLAANAPTDAELLARYNTSDNPAGDIILSALNAHQRVKDAIGLTLVNDALYNNAQGAVKEITNNANSSIEAAKTTSSTASAINISNDMAISTRIAAANNPYSYLAALNGKHFANLGVYPALYYMDLPYKNGVWTNAFGGASIIDNKGGGLFGISVGYDQKSFEGALLGVYFSYANALIKDGRVEQRSNNYQVGFYSSFNPLDELELNFKFYGQLAPTRQTSSTSVFDEMSARFTRHFAGVSFNGGWIFSYYENTFFVKPLLGLNYYYTYTPGYIEKGEVAQDVQSITNHAASAEFGVDLRQYIGQNSFLYLTPKLEQYFVESGDDYVAGFIGSNTSFTIRANRYKKTYAQMILGGNFDVSEHFNISLGFGVKQAIKCACDSNSETYLSGNLGLRYRY